jgi:hypothetical protein
MFDKFMDRVEKSNDDNTSGTDHVGVDFGSEEMAA